MKQLLKKILVRLHISLTRNQRYDAYTRAIIEKSLRPDSNSIDIGCHRGEILDLMIRNAPLGKKIGFEPVPELYRSLKDKYRTDPLVSISPVALYDKAGTTSFQHVVNEPAYSGIKKRRYDGKQVVINQITVDTDTLDRVLDRNTEIDLIKIDVEGAEFPVMKGGVETIKRCRPVIIFECGLGASEFYDTHPEDVFDLIRNECNLKISTLKDYLDGQPPLSRDDFIDHYNLEKEYYFVAHPR